MSDLMTFAEAAERLAVRESWLRTQVTAKAIPHVRLGRHVRFSETDLEQIVADNQKAPVRPRRRLRSAS